MAHHGSSPISDDSILAEFFNRGRQAAREAGELGATGRYPHGKLTEEDEGEIAIAVGQHDGKVVIDFGKPTAWIGFTAEQAEELGNLILQHGRELRR